jgi:hypothetical protein
MKFYINTLNDNGSGMEYNTKEKFLHKLSLMIDDCIANGGTFFDANIDADASCFLVDSDDGKVADIYLEMEELLECDMKTGNIKVGKQIFDDFVPNSCIKIQFVDTDDEVMSYTMVAEDDEGIFMKIFTDCV